MLQVTSQARRELHGMLLRALDRHIETDASQLGIRLVTGGAKGEASQPGLMLDAPRLGDEVMEQDGYSVLIVDASTSDLLEGLTLDLIETPSGRRLGLRQS